MATTLEPPMSAALPPTLERLVVPAPPPRVRAGYAMRSDQLTPPVQPAPAITPLSQRVGAMGLFGLRLAFTHETDERHRLAEGTVKRYARVAESGRTVNFGFCPECGGTVFWEAELRPGLIAVAVGTFADPSFEKPSLSVWERMQHPWTKAIDAQRIEHLE